MENKNLIGMIITLAVAIICVATILVPIIDDAQQNANPASVTNTTSVVLREVEVGDVLKCDREIITKGSTYSDTWYLNGEEVQTLAGLVVSNNPGIISDGLYMQIQSKTSTAGTFYNMATSTPTPGYFGASSSTEAGEVESTTFTFEDDTIEVVTNSGSTLSVSYTWAYVVCPPEDGEYYAAATGGTGYISGDADVLLCGAYTTGDFDTMYYYKDGTAYTSNSSYTMTVDIEKELTSGYTDIYTATISADVTDGSDTETFTPYRVFLPYVVDGHAASGAAYALYAVVPVLVLIAVMMLAVGFIRGPKD